MTRPGTPSRAALLVGLVALATSLTACSPTQDADGRVSVLGIWTGDEETAFREVLDAFTDETGIAVDYQGTRAVNDTLRARVRQGNPPDVAMPRPGELASYLPIEGHPGDVHPLDDVIDPADQEAYGREALFPDGEHIYAVPVKADLTSLIWYNRHQFTGPQPRTWEQLVATTQAMVAAGQTPWCLGMGDPPSSGWPGSDWIEDILLHQAGPAAYQQWTAGELAWTSQQVRDAWASWGAIVGMPDAVRGGAPAALLTHFTATGRPLFSDPPGCLLVYQPSFAMGIYRGEAYEVEGGTMPRPGTDFDFFLFPEFGTPTGEPSGGVVLSSVDLAAMFNATPEAKKLMRFLASRQAQEIWPRRSRSSAFSVHQEVDHDSVYGRDDHDLRRRIAELLTDPDITVCQDGSDLMPTAMRNAFHRAVQEYLNDPGQLEALLEGLDQVRETVDPEAWLEVPCGG